MADTKAGRKTFYPKTRSQWRKWLEKNHNPAENIWLIFYKKNSGIPTVSYNDAVEEALCFGWIDSRPNKIDEYCYMQLFSPRKPKSIWAKTNKARVEKLIREGLMTLAGMKKIEAAKKDGSWDALNEIDDLKMPADFQKALSGNKTALKNFNAFSDSSKKIILFWIKSAKQEITRQKRISETVKLAAKNIKANHYRQ